MIKKNKNKILIINSNISQGGIETQISYIVKGLVSNGYIVKYVFYNKNRNNSIIDENTIKTEYIAWRYGFSRNRIKYVFYPIYFMRLLIYIIKDKPDIIHTYGPIENITAAFIKMLTGIKIVASVRTNAKDAFRLITFWGRLSDAVLVNAESVKQQLESFYNIKNKNITCIYNGIDLIKYKYCFSKSNFIRKNCYKYGLIGRINTSKNQLVALQAFKKMLENDKSNSRVKLIFIGKIEDKNYYKKILDYIVNNDLKQYIELRQWSNDIIDFYNEIDCILLPSVSEGMPNIIIESMAVGVPWISFDVSDIQYLAGKNTRGIITKENTVNALAVEMQNIKKLATRKINEMCVNGRKFIEKHHSLEELNKNILHFYQSIIK